MFIVGEKENIKLLVAGEFYEDDKPYHDMIRELQLEDRVILRTQFIPDSEVRNYVCAGDCVVQPYKSTTQSGITIERSIMKALNLRSRFEACNDCPAFF